MELETVQSLYRTLCTERGKLATLRDAATSVTLIQDGLPHAQALTSRTESFAVKITDCEQRIIGITDALSQAIEHLAGEIYKRIHDATEFEVMLKRYVLCKQFKEIALEMNLSEQRIFQLHRRAKKKYLGSEKI